MVSSSRFNASQRRPLLRKEKIIPNKQLGVEALPTITETMEGVLDWLKSERLHKYWPVFSRMNYPTLIGLTEDKIDHALKCIGSEPITNGARGRILRCTERLRERCSHLETINDTSSLCEIAEVFQIIATTPLSATDNEPNGVCLLKMFLRTLNQVVGFHGPDIVKNPKLRTALETYIERREVPKADKEYVERLLNNLILAAGSATSPNRSTYRPGHGPSRPPTSPIIRAAPQVEKASFQQRLANRSPGSSYKQSKAPVDRARHESKTEKTEISGFSKSPPLDKRSSIRLPGPKKDAFININIPEDATLCTSIDLNKQWGGGKNQVMFNLNVISIFTSNDLQATST